MKPENYPITACTPSYTGPQPSIDDWWNMHLYLFSRKMKKLKRKGGTNDNP